MTLRCLLNPWRFKLSQKVPDPLTRQEYARFIEKLLKPVDYFWKLAVYSGSIMVNYALWDGATLIC